MPIRSAREKLLKDYDYLTINTQNKTKSSRDKNSLCGAVAKSTKTEMSTSFSNSSSKSRNNLHIASSQLTFNCTNKGKGSSHGMCMNSDKNNLIGQRSKILSSGSRRRTTDKFILSPSQCKPIGLKFIDDKQKINIINMQLNDGKMKANVDDLLVPQQRRKFIETRTRATQTLFRENSVQTFPYLPGVSNDSTESETLKIFRLPTILTENDPPGLCEVEVLQKARTRWAFAEALKENVRKQLDVVRDHAKLQEHEHILEAFEWEHWIEREESIQELQMLRLEILIRMFDKREGDMHTTSKNIIQKSYEEIEVKRKAALKKNELQYNRATRRLEIKHSKHPRAWRKENITQTLSVPYSEFFAPKMRYGVNLSSRHFTASSKGFDVHMQDFNNRVTDITTKDLTCPLAKLRQSSKPKKIFLEVEQNFCSDLNLNKLYKSLRGLREKSKNQKYTPLCLEAKISKKKEIKVEAAEVGSAATDTLREAEQIHINFDSPNKSKSYKPLIHFDTVDISEDTSSESIKLAESFEKLRQQKQAERFNMEIIYKEMRCEELEALIIGYDCNAIGWLMRFLLEEMSRLKEQRKLQFFTMMSKRERWHREAAEAGLRQKENLIRKYYEKLYDDCDQINKDVTEKFLNSILSTDIKDYARHKVEQNIVPVAKSLDKEISGWLESFTEVQNPSNFHVLRHALKDVVVPDLDKTLLRLEMDKCIKYIINNVLLGKVYQSLEPYDISFQIATNFVDRLLNNDLYLNSTDCSSDSESCGSAENGVKAIIRKIIRYSVPGIRWLTNEERIVAENISDLLHEVFDKVITERHSFINVDMSYPPNVASHRAYTDLICVKKVHKDFGCNFDEPIEFDHRAKFNIFKAGYDTIPIDITKSLQWNEKLLLDDPDLLSNDALLMNTNKYIPPEPKVRLSTVRVIPSTHNLSLISNFCTTPVYTQTSSEERLDIMQLEAEEMGEDISLLNQYFAEQLESEEESNSDKEKQRQDFEIDETQQLEELQESTQCQTIKIIQNPDVKVIAIESEHDEDSTSSLIQVSFSYNPEVNFSVAMPSNDEDVNSLNDLNKL